MIYLCPVLNKTFSTHCVATDCPLHVGNLNKSGLNIKPRTGCGQADYNLQGHDGKLSNAVETQGFVGYRDISNIAPFCGVDQMSLRDLYESQLHLFRKASAIYFHYLNSDYADQELAGKEQDILLPVFHTYLKPLPKEVWGKVCRIIWENMVEKSSPIIDLNSSERKALIQVYGDS